MRMFLGGVTMKNMLAVLLFLAFCSLAFAEERYGGFLQENLNVRATALGDAFVGLASEEGFVYNPAGLAFTKKVSAGVSMAKGYNEMNGIEVVVPLVSDGGLGIGYNYTSLKVSGIEERDETGEKRGEFSDEETMNAFGMGLQFEKNLGVGILVKNMKQDLKDIHAKGFTVDAGVLYRATDFLWLGSVLTNIKGNGLTWDNSVAHKDLLPVTMKNAAAIKLFDGGFNTAIEYETELGEKERAVLKFGQEVWIQNTFAARVGVKSMLKADSSENSNNFTLGAGLKLGVVTADYSYSKEELGDVHRVAFGLKF